MAKPGDVRRAHRAVLTTFALFRDFTLFTVQIAVWLWFTLLFANFAEAMAENRGKAHADTLRANLRKSPPHPLASRPGAVLFGLGGDRRRGLHLDRGIHPQQLRLAVQQTDQHLARRLPAFN
jgi:hypothetical protein